MAESEFNNDDNCKHMILKYQALISYRAYQPSAT